MKSTLTVAIFCIFNFFAFACEDHVKEIDAGIEQDGLSEVEEGAEVPECLNVERTLDSPESKVVLGNEQSLEILKFLLEGNQRVFGLVFEQFGPGSLNGGTLRIRSESEFFEVKPRGRIVSFDFELDMEGSLRLVLETDLNDSMWSGDRFGYRLVEVITTDGGCVNGLPVESALFVVASP